MNIHCIKNFFTVHDFWATCACPEKNRVALKIFTVVNNILFTFRICNNFRLTWKQSFPWNFSLYWIYFLLFRIFEQRRLPWKKQGCPEIFTVFDILFTLRIFEQLALALKNRVALNSQYWIYIFYYSGFWATCACLEKQSFPGIFHCNETFFIIQDVWATRACPEKQSCPAIFTVLNILLTFRIFE